MAMAAFRIWFAQSRLCWSCFLVLLWRPPGGTRGTGSHHFSSRRWKATLKEAEPSQSGAAIPCSTYQNSGSLKLSRISCQNMMLWENWTFRSTALNSQFRKKKLTRSIWSSFRSAGRLMYRSDRGLLVMIWIQHEDICAISYSWSEMHCGTEYWVAMACITFQCAVYKSNVVYLLMIWYVCDLMTYMMHHTCKHLMYVRCLNSNASYRTYNLMIYILGVQCIGNK
jgi:hypothetical protein